MPIIGAVVSASESRWLRTWASMAFLNATDPQDRSMHRGRLLPAFWDLATAIAARSGGKLAAPHRMLLRLNVLKKHRCRYYQKSPQQNK